MRGADPEEIAFFDTLPSPVDNGPGFNGAWGVYPFLPSDPSGTLLVSNIEDGLFVLAASDRTVEPPVTPNESPEAVGTLGDRTLRPTDGAAVDVTAAFRDPDGDVLTYGARSSAASVATVSVSGSTVTGDAVVEGLRDGDGDRHRRLEHVGDADVRRECGRRRRWRRRWRWRWRPQPGAGGGRDTRGPDTGGRREAAGGRGGGVPGSRQPGAAGMSWDRIWISTRTGAGVRMRGTSTGTAVPAGCLWARRRRRSQRRSRGTGGWFGTCSWSGATERVCSG